MVKSLNSKCVKVIGTLGPSTMRSEIIGGMLSAGASGFRINMSHGSASEWDEMLYYIKKAEESTGVYPAIIFDLEGPRIRVKADMPVRVKPGDQILICREPVIHKENLIGLTPYVVIDQLEPNDLLLVDDGKTILKIEDTADVKGKRCWSSKVLEGYWIEPNKGVVVRGKHLDLPSLTQKDLRSLDYVRDKPVSHIMLSYASGKAHVEMLREELNKRGLENVKILAKIETPNAVNKINEIAAASDGIVIARGDLGMHYPLDQLPIVSKEIAEAALRHHRILIHATEILTSMITRPLPTRAEVVDIYRAIELGSDALLLTGETAIGKHPVKTVEWANKIVATACHYTKPPRYVTEPVPYRLALALVQIAEDLDAPIIVYSRKGRLPHRVASFKPRIPVFTGTPNKIIYRQILILRNIYPMLVEDLDYVKGVEATYSKLIENGILSETDLAVEATWSGKHKVYQIKVKNISY